MRHSLCLGLVLLLWAGRLPAEEQRLTVAQAVELALQQHGSLQVSAHELRAARAQLRAAGARAPAELSITPGGLGSEPVEERVSIAQALEVNGARRARSQVARGALAEAEAAAALAHAELVRQVKQAYWEAALREQLVGLDHSNLEFAEELLRAARTQYELGNQPQVQVLKAEVEVGRARQDLLGSQAAAAQARAGLNTLLGRELQAKVMLAEAAAPVTAAWPLTQLTELGLGQRRDLRLAQAAVETARGEVAAARAARRPDLTLLGRLTTEGTGGVALSLNLPHLDWGGRRAECERAEALLAARQQQADLAATAARLQIANALSQLQTAQAQATDYREQVLQRSRQLADLAMLGYREGASAFLDVLDARRTLRAVNVEYYSAVAAQHHGLAELEFAVGGSLPDPVKPSEVK